MGIFPQENKSSKVHTHVSTEMLTGAPAQTGSSCFHEHKASPGNRQNNQHVKEHVKATHISFHHFNRQTRYSKEQFLYIRETGEQRRLQTVQAMNETNLAQRQYLFLLENLPLKLHSASTSSVSGLVSPCCSATPSTSKSTTKAAATKEPSRHSKCLCIELPFFSPCGTPRTEQDCIQI